MRISGSALFRVTPIIVPDNRLGIVSAATS